MLRSQGKMSSIFLMYRCFLEKAPLMTPPCLCQEALPWIWLHKADSSDSRGSAIRSEYPISSLVSKNRHQRVRACQSVQILWRQRRPLEYLGLDLHWDPTDSMFNIKCRVRSVVPSRWLAFCTSWWLQLSCREICREVFLPLGIRFPSSTSVLSLCNKVFTHCVSSFQAPSICQVFLVATTNTVLKQQQ